MTLIIGVDCATEPAATGLALSTFGDAGLVIDDVRVGSRRCPPTDIIAGWLRQNGPALLALDAPLGWPQSLGAALAGHTAGECPSPTADQLFRRATDDAVYERLGKRPLDVGADRIARTARAALELLRALRERIGRPIPLCWQPEGLMEPAAIEVYPAATRIGHGAPPGAGSLEGLSTAFAVSPGLVIPDSPDARDAVVCTVAGADFLRGKAVKPTDMALALREGWIWAA